ncbi:MAG TPA: hypothetical protein VFM74_08095, partial [Candidatus Limnocylindria bacterium]|nr:hypothetical protein [Candidatus Limnocylindria bacterium]
IELNEIIAAKAISWRSRGVVAIDIAGPVVESFRFGDYADIFAECRRAGLGVTVHAGETGGPDEVREAVEALEPTRIGHGIKSALDPKVMDLLRERQVVLEICPSSNLSTRVVRDLREVRQLLGRLIEHEVPFAVSTDGPEMLRSYLRDELNLLLRNEILTLDEVHRSLQVAHDASFVDRAPVREPAPLPLHHASADRDAPFSVEVGV